MIKEILNKFNIEGELINITENHSGNINKTFVATFKRKDGSERKYLIQKINTTVFAEPYKLMKNIEGVTAYLKRQMIKNGDTTHQVPEVIKTKDNKLLCYVNDETGTRKYYRIYEFIENAVSYDHSQDKEIVYNTGKAFGNFQRLLGNYPMSKLEETIKDFHDTKKRYDKLMDDIKIDSEGRVAEVANEIVFILMREDICSLIMDDLGTEEIPYRVTHNDTKVNNVMMNKIDIPDRGKKKRVVIVGGGFGGLKLARKLKNDQFQVVLLDKNNYHLFQPLLYQVATAGIEPSAISFPFRKIFKKRKYFHIRICEARRVIPEQKLLETSIGAIDYDYLVIATGCYTNYFGNNKMAEKTMSLKTTAEALYNRNQVLESFEKAQNTTDPKEREKLMTFIIVGGGATGIELSGALAEMRKFILPQDYPDLDMKKMRIVLIDAGSRLLSAFSEKSSEEVRDYLQKKGVEVKVNSKVVDYENDLLTLGDGTVLPSANIYWVAGVKANSLEGLPVDAYGPGNRLKVDAFNKVSGSDHIFAIGDTALMISEDYPRGHPQVVQPAIQQARLLVRNLNNIEKGLPLKPFVYHNKGSMATVGRNNAIVELKNIRFGGFLAWAVWLFIHLMSIVGVKNKLFIFTDWMWSYFTYDPSLRLIIKPVKKEKEDENE